MGIKRASVSWLGALGLGLALPLAAPVIAAVSPPATAQEGQLTPELLVQSQLGAQWMAAFALLMGAIAAVAGIDRYIKNQRWERRDLARRVFETVARKPAVRNVADILDFEEYRHFEVQLPTEDRRVVRFEATDERLKRALRSHDQMVKTRQGLNVLMQMSRQQSGKLDENTIRVVQQYRDEEFIIELTLRDWFDEFLGAFEACENAIQSGLVTAEDLEPYIIYWVRVISDRSYRRQGGSAFYDQLFHYIYWAGYTGVQKLFERYGYKILPPPYSTHDFAHIERDHRVRDAFRSLCMAKASHLVYEDVGYVEDIVRLWLGRDSDYQWMGQSPADYTIDVIKRWLREGETDQKGVNLRANYRYFMEHLTDTQAFIFRKGHHIVLVFRGSQQAADWSTNFKFRMKQFAFMNTAQATMPPQGEVHRGFHDAWQSVEDDILTQLKQWWKPDSQLWVTGHSLGGALATLAATSLEYQGFTVAGLYTFGQPRVGDWAFVREVNERMGDRMFRYVNNNDIVPLTPPQVNPLNPGRLYGHMGQFRYFSFRGKLFKKSYLTQRWFDRLLGFLVGIKQPGADVVADHMMEFYVRYLQRELDRQKDLCKAHHEHGLEAQEVREMEKAR